MTDTDGYDAVVLGSPVYMGNWQPEVRQFVERYRTRLARMPVWLFSSGPVGRGSDDPRFYPRKVTELMQVTHARDHRIFPGKIDAGALTLGGRLVVRVVRAPNGDVRNWEATRDWARKIAAALRPH